MTLLKSKISIATFFLLVLAVISSSYVFSRSLQDLMFFNANFGTDFFLNGFMTPGSQTKYFDWPSEQPAALLLRGERFFVDEYPFAQKAIFDKYPNSPVWRANFVRAAGNSNEFISTPDLIEIAKAEPGNAFYDLMISGRLLLSILPKDPRLTLDDWSKADRVYEYFFEASKKPYFNTYVEEVVKAKHTSVPENDIPSQTVRIAINATQMIPGYTSGLTLYRELPNYLKYLIDNGENEKAEALMEAAQKIVRLLASDTHAMIDIIIIRSVTATMAKTFPELYKRLGKPEKGEKIRRWGAAVCRPLFEFRKEKPPEIPPSKFGKMAKFLLDSMPLNKLSLSDLQFNKRTESLFILRCWGGILITPVLFITAMYFLFSKKNRNHFITLLIFTLGVYPALLYIEAYRIKQDKIFPRDVAFTQYDAMLKNKLFEKMIPELNADNPPEFTSEEIELYLTANPRPTFNYKNLVYELVPFMPQDRPEEDYFKADPKTFEQLGEALYDFLQKNYPKRLMPGSMVTACGLLENGKQVLYLTLYVNNDYDAHAEEIHTVNSLEMKYDIASGTLALLRDYAIGFPPSVKQP